MLKILYFCDIEDIIFIFIIVLIMEFICIYILIGFNVINIECFILVRFRCIFVGIYNGLSKLLYMYKIIFYYIVCLSNID